MYVIGTAGHVDHGKSALVRALTGIEPDRLREEQERGLTIDLGFAWLTLPSGRDASIVDVPGHERFIKNMLAGAGGIDLALLVVAADEGPMPQTHEHLAILDLLGISTVVGVVTRCDLVEPEFAELVQVEVEEVLGANGFAESPVVRVSAVTGDGLPALSHLLDETLATLAPKRDLGRPRVPVDRVFTVAGFGTVVTGTLVDGALEVGDEVELQPGGVRGRVRGLQRHRTKVARLEPGTRAAVNLSGVQAEDVTRGMVLALPRTVRATTAADLRLRATAALTHPLAHDAGVTVLSATAESEGRLRLLDRDELLPGDECWAQVVLAAPMPLVRGDHCVLRMPNETVAGGVIVAIDAPRHRRRHGPTLEALARTLAGTPADRLADLLLTGPTTVPAAALKLHLAVEEVTAAAAELVHDGAAEVADSLVIGRPWLDRESGRLATAVAGYLSANPLRAGVPREVARSTARLSASQFPAVLRHALGSGLLEEKAGTLAPPGYEVTLPASLRVTADAYLAALLAAGASPAVPPPPDQLLQYLAERGDIVIASPGVAFHAATFAGLVERVTASAMTEDGITIAQLRDLVGTSRKYAQAILEHLDATHVLRREGDRHVIRQQQGPPR